MLDEYRGRSENLQVPTTISKHDASVSKYESSALLGQRTFAVRVMKSSKGYGFSVSAHNPIYITQVIKGGLCN